MPPDIVIRPSGVWNSRAPFHNFFVAHRQHQRTYNLLTAALGRLLYEAKPREGVRHQLRKLFKADRAGGLTNYALGSFIRTFPRASSGQFEEPPMETVAKCLHLATYQVREGMLIAYVASFENFVQCWALNYLLAKLESGVNWSASERSLATSFSPVHSSGVTPNAAAVLDRFEWVKEQLASVVVEDLTRVETGQIAFKDASACPNAPTVYNVLRFWRDFRNLLVHHGNVVSRAFWREHNDVFELLRTTYVTRMKPLRMGQPLDLYHDLFRAMSEIHYHVADWMNDNLATVAGSRRGHSFAPQQRSNPPKPIPNGYISRKLLIEGDHPASYLWLTDERFRLDFIRQNCGAA